MPEADTAFGIGHMSNRRILRFYNRWRSNGEMPSPVFKVGLFGIFFRPPRTRREFKLNGYLTAAIAGRNTSRDNWPYVCHVSGAFISGRIRETYRRWYWK